MAIHFEQIEKIIAAREYWSGQSFTEESAALPEPVMPERVRLEWRPGMRPDPGRYVSLDEARQMMAERMAGYAAKSRQKAVLLVRAQPGIGKTYAGVALAQEAAQAGSRVLYAMPTHAHWQTICDMPHFEFGRWYHWLAQAAESPKSGNTMCLYANAMSAWTAKGYASMDLCESLCPMYQADCEYRLQKNRHEAIIAGTHQHIAMGMSISDFDLVIVDELPLQAFIKERLIPRDKLYLGDVGPASDLAKRLAEWPIERGHISGLELLNIIGPQLDDVYAQVTDYKRALPMVPSINRPADIEQAPYWYLTDLLTLLAGEKKAWEEGQKRWLERVVLTKEKLILLNRQDPWSSLPSRVVVLDATGTSGVYRQIFERDVVEFAPPVERKGRIYQTANRLNGIGTFLEEIPGTKKQYRLAKQGLETLELCKAIIAKNGYQKPGVVTFMNAVGEFSSVFGDRTLHYYGQRGSNSLEDVDALFVVGCPQPPDQKVMEYARAINPKRIRSFLTDEKDDGKIFPVRSCLERRYQIWRENGHGSEQASRLISGFWHDHDLHIMEEVYREQELVQAVHRARPILREVDIWLLTNLPIEEDLTAIFEDPAEILGAPEGFNWQAWVKVVGWIHANPGKILTYKIIPGHSDAGLDEITGMDPKWLREQKWIPALIEKIPGVEAEAVVTGRRPADGAKVGKC